jgi:hypothetical protein
MLNTLRDTFRDPPREYGMIPFWFWNDDLDDAEIIRQIREFHAKNFGGFIPHARIGLSRRVGYLTDEWFRYIRLAVDEAARLGMKVVLYDEGSYPSGSACGQVVHERPDLAARCLITTQKTVTGPQRGYWRPSTGRALNDRLLCVVQAREVGENAVDPDTLTVLASDDHGITPYSVQSGTWRLIAVRDVQSGSSIRGVHAEEEDGHALAPAFADIMNPEAVDLFIRLTHDRYYEHLREYFGTTVVAMFTDETNPLGRGARRGPNPKPFTPALLDDLSTQWNDDILRWLPALWLDCGARGEEFRRVYDATVYDRVNAVFYGAQSRWCEQHGIALTGHPAQSDEMTVLRAFHWPGQDMVWRYVEPDSPSAIEGNHSTASKSATSAMVIDGKKRATMETFGAYGWHLTLDEVKWLLDWHLVRGNNVFFPHALFYSLRDRRAFESEPDIGIHNVWWPQFGMIADYARRVSWLISDGKPVCDVAILSDPMRLAWRAARELYREQIDFLYIDTAALDNATVEYGRLNIGDVSFSTVVCDPVDIDTGHHERLEQFVSKGGLLLTDWDTEHLVEHITHHTGRDLAWSGRKPSNASDLRVLHYSKEAHDFYFLTNEGQKPIEGTVTLRALGAVELWDPQTGDAVPWSAIVVHNRTKCPVRLDRRESIILAIDPSQSPSEQMSQRPIVGDVIADVVGVWHASTLNGEAVNLRTPGNWAEATGWETFTGTLSFATTFVFSGHKSNRRVFLDLGTVGDIADVDLNGIAVGARAWSPYVFDVTEALRNGVNHITVRVTNSMANEYDGAQRPSGLIGPVTLRGAR